MRSSYCQRLSGNWPRARKRTWVMELLRVFAYHHLSRNETCRTRANQEGEPLENISDQTSQCFNPIDLLRRAIKRCSSWEEPLAWVAVGAAAPCPYFGRAIVDCRLIPLVSVCEHSNEMWQRHIRRLLRSSLRFLQAAPKCLM